MDGIAFVKGHGTANDFVVLPDPDGALALDPELVRALCDRHTGIGADGVLRVVRADAEPDAAAMAGDAHWFMDYRNADGSISETCGNGLRVFVRYLVDARLAVSGELLIATRAGVVRAWADVDGDVTVDMGIPQLVGASSARVGADTFTGTKISIGNPHLVCITETDVDVLDLSRAPVVEAVDFPDGANVEFVNRVGPDAARMRVHERGVGETLSCGSGVCAAGVALAVADGLTDAAYTVDVRGGRLQVRLEGGRVLLRGSAVLVAEGRWCVH